jgi:hypothetical protein
VGDPQPPFIRIPEPVTNLAAAQSGYNVILSWTNPPRYIDGSAATNLARVQIRSGGQLLATVNVAAAGQPQSYAIPVRSDLGHRLTFTVVVETTQGRVSEVSNVASVEPVEVPGSVFQLHAVADQRRIFLEWKPPKDHPELADEYLVVRTDLPAEAATVRDTRYEDVRYQAGQSFTYQVTALRRIGPMAVPGVGPEMTTVAAIDKTPPTTPAGLEVRPSDTGAFLTWEPNNETDLAGYRVFCSEWSNSGFRPVTERLLKGNSFLDMNYRPGVYYAVSAVDESENESPMSAPVHAP